MIETSIDIIGEGALESPPILPLPPPNCPELPPSDGCIGCIAQMLPWTIGITAVGTMGYLSWRLISKHNEIPPSI